ncbi:hypothetical protein M8J77_003165 [Diaphorina citri]|nr:hypothetical protein M8J77_003165 [Diaphorina citri]
MKKIKKKKKKRKKKKKEEEKTKEEKKKKKYIKRYDYRDLKRYLQEIKKKKKKKKKKNRDLKSAQHNLLILTLLWSVICISSKLANPCDHQITDLYMSTD